MTAAPRPLEVREIAPHERELAWALGALAFGGDPAGPVTPAKPGALPWGAFDGDQLVAKATLRPYTQWWGGRRVPMGGLAGVAVHPHARGQGAAAGLVRRLLGQMRAGGLPVSALFPTAPGIYRRLGWEVVGALEDTVLPTSVLRGAGDVADATVRTAGPDDSSALAALWQQHGVTTPGALTRDGPSFPRGPEQLLTGDVVALAEQDGRATGYLAYDRGSGYGAASELHVRDLVALTPAALSVLLRSLGSWDAVAATVRWTGPLAEAGLLLRATLPPPVRSRPWMLRVNDAVAAVAARGFRPEVAAQAAFTLVDGVVPGHEGAWQLTVQGGAGRLDRTARGAPRLDVRGLALLYAGAADTNRLLRAGLLEAPVPGLDVFAGPAPVLLDYF